MTQEDLYTTAWDVVVIGGGASGMMAAGTAAERGLRVLLLEKNDDLGKKLRITGGGRCNVTNAEFDTRTLLQKFKESDKFLFSAFSQWNVQDTITFFESRGMPTKVEAEKRVFPVSDSAESVWKVLVDNLQKHKATVHTKTQVTALELSEDSKSVREVRLKNGKSIRGTSYIIATGGTSHPETGSTGDGFVWLQNCGHTVIQPTPSLVPLTSNVAWVKSISGYSIPEAKISVLQNNVKQASYTGKILFTHTGVSGPGVLNLSSEVRELLKYGEVELALDLQPNHDYGTLNFRLQELFLTHKNKKIKNALDELIPSALIVPTLTQALVPEDTPSNSITRDQRLALVQTLKSLRIPISGLLGNDKAIIASGGVTLAEIDTKTMRSKVLDNLFITGDLLNIERPSGGYSLQLCWTTGFVAGSAC